MIEEYYKGKAEKIKKNWDREQAHKLLWSENWDDVIKYVMPRKDNVYGQLVPGEKRANRLFDTEVIAANDELTAAFHTLLCPPTMLWFGFRSGMSIIDNDDEARKWFAECAQIQVDIMNASNFHTEITEIFQDVGSVGTSVLRIEEDEEDDVRYYSQSIYSCAIREDVRKEVRFVTRSYEYDMEQVMEEFGEQIQNSPKLKEYFSKNHPPDKKFKFIQEVGKRPSSEQKGLGPDAMPFYSCHVLESPCLLVKDSGFESWPFATPRFSKITEEVYGRSPAMKAMADVKMINQMKKVTIQGAQLAIAPPLQAPHNSFLAPLNVNPFGVNYRRTQDKAEPLFVGARPDLGLDLIENIKQSVNTHFFRDKLKTIIADRMTATEVIQRRDENYRFFIPMLTRMDRELLKPCIDRTFDILYRRNKFPAPPESITQYLADGKIKIEYLSPIAQAQKAILSENITRAIVATQPIMGAQPEVMDILDGEKILRKNLEYFNVSPDVIRSEREIRQIRAARQQAMQQSANNSQALNEAEVINKIGQVDAGNQATQE
jgi:hypothetical protein